MALLNSYAIWNNKGGVGKSTITFHIASRYAEQRPEENVLVVDMCPQANSSMMLLGGGTAGESKALGFCTLSTPRTVVGYLSHVISNGPGAALPDPMSFVVHVTDENEQMPTNLYLLCGDGNLEPMAPAISQAASAPPLTAQSSPWRWIHGIIRNLVDSVASSGEANWTIFVDTNPSFAIYTELAVSAVDRLITPVNADDSSRVATNAMFILLHGQTPPHPVYGAWTFASRAQTEGVGVPRIHVIVGNRLTQYGGAAAAFAALSDATATTLYNEYQHHPEYFTDRPTPPSSLTEFRQDYSTPLRDFNTAGVVAAHLGRPLSKMEDRTYTVHGGTVTVDGRRVAECLQAVDELVAQL